MANLHSVLILGPDAVAAASPATPVQLVHACHRWGFASVVPASWGDELLAGEVIRRCAARENRPAIQCSCPRVAERLGAHASKLDDAIFWLATPPVAAAQYIRAHAGANDVHITYAGSCPGAIDSSIDQRMTPTELLMAISARGIDLGAQPTVFENIIPPDRRRHLSGAAGTPDQQRLWESAAFRVAHPSDVDLAIGVAQLLLGDDRVLIDITPRVGCVCRTVASLDSDPASALRSPTPVVRENVIDVGRAAPVIRESTVGISGKAPVPNDIQQVEPAEPPRQTVSARRQSPGKPVFRRHTVWKRQTPRPGVVVARQSAVVVTVPAPTPVLKRPAVQFAIVGAVAVAGMMLGMWIRS